MNLEELSLLPEPDALTLKRLEEIVLSPWFRTVLGKVAREIIGKKTQMLEANFSTDEGVRLAIRLQGEASGMARVLDLLDEGVE